MVSINRMGVGMGFKILFAQDKPYRIECENAISLWNVLKETVDMPYLKSFVVENYEGGNTLVPIDTWKHDEIMYREIADKVYLFPYESIGFVLDDSIDNADIFVIEAYTDNLDYRKNCLVQISVSDIETLSVTFDNPAFAYKLASLYLTTIMKLRYDAATFASLENLLAGIVTPKTMEIVYLDGTLRFGIKGMDFKMMAVSEDKPQYYKITFENRWKKQVIKANDVKDPSFIKKKYLNRKWYLKLIYYLIWIAIFGFALIGAPKLFHISMKQVIKYLTPLVIIFIAYRVLIVLFRNNYYKIYHSKTK